MFTFIKFFFLFLIIEIRGEKISTTNFLKHLTSEHEKGHVNTLCHPNNNFAQIVQTFSASPIILSGCTSKYETKNMEKAFYTLTTSQNLIIDYNQGNKINIWSTKYKFIFNLFFFQLGSSLNNTNEAIYSSAELLASYVTKKKVYIFFSEKNINSPIGNFTTHLVTPIKNKDILTIKVSCPSHNKTLMSNIWINNGFLVNFEHASKCPHPLSGKHLSKY